MSKSNKTGRSIKGDRYVKLQFWLLNTEAWGDLGAIPRAIYVEICKRYNGSNNGFIVYSVRQAAIELKIGKSTAARGFLDLQSHGFIVAEQRGAFHWKIDVTGLRHRPASEWRLTEYPSDRATGLENKMSTKDFARWPEIQNTVPPQVRMVPDTGPHGTCSGTMENKKGRNGTCSGTIKAISRG